MEHNYLLNPAIRMLVEQIEPGSLEREVQVAVECVLWTVFPASDYWMTATKYKQGATEPDNKTSKLTQYLGGWAPVEVLMVELKRPQEVVNMGEFNRVAYDLLDDHMSESSNPDGTIIFGCVGIGAFFAFYQKELPRGTLQTTQTRPFHLIHDANSIQEYFNYYKVNIPQSALSPAHPLTGQGSHTYEEPTSSYYQAPASSYPAQEPSPEAPTETYHAPESSHQASTQEPTPESKAPTASDQALASSYQEGDNDYQEGDPETQQSHTARYITVQVEKKPRVVHPDEFHFTDKNGKTKVTLREDWNRTRLNGTRCWTHYRKNVYYVCYRDIFRK